MLKTLVMDFLAFKPEFSRRLSRIFFSASSRLSRNFHGRLAGLAQIAAAGRLSRRLKGLKIGNLCSCFSRLQCLGPIGLSFLSTLSLSCFLTGRRKDSPVWKFYVLYKLVNPCAWWSLANSTMTSRSTLSRHTVGR